MNTSTRNILNDLKLTSKYLAVAADNMMNNPGFEDSNIDDMMGYAEEISFLITKLDQMQAEQDFLEGNGHYKGDF